MKESVICWWSGGVTSAVACNLAIQLYTNCRIIFIDTKNEDIDTYRFKKDCEKWYGKNIEILTNEKYNTIQDVWRKYKSLNVAHGAICSSELKRVVRMKFQKENNYRYQVFGFDINEPKRAIAMTLNYPDARPIYPLLLHGLSKKDCIKIINNVKIEIPRTYKWGFNNNNCFETGCVQGGIGYWQKMYREKPILFNNMADMEHELTNIAKKPVTMCKDQSIKAKNSMNILVFLKKHPEYPYLKTVLEMKGRKPQPLIECNGYCGTNDLSTRNTTELELNF